MAISTLSKITVPLASDTSSSTQGLLMPKLQYRFRVTLENFGVSTPTTELTKQVMDVTRPVVNFEEIEIPVYNSRAYLAGKHAWDPITLNLREDVNNNVQKLVGGYIQEIYTNDTDKQYWVNEEGLLYGLPQNHEASHILGQPVVGNLVVLSGISKLD